METGMDPPRERTMMVQPRKGSRKLGTSGMGTDMVSIPDMDGIANMEPNMEPDNPSGGRLGRKAGRRHRSNDQRKRNGQRSAAFHGKVLDMRCGRTQGSGMSHTGKRFHRKMLPVRSTWA